MARLILASGSPQRKRILKMLGIPFRAIPSDIDEHHDGLTRPHAVAKSIALRKALAVAAAHPRDWVLGVDTLVVLASGKICGKPKNRAEAKKVILSYSGRHCDVYSGIALVNLSQKKQWVDLEKSRLIFHKFQPSVAEAYLDLNTWQGSSGSMTIEGAGEKLIKKRVGEYWNIVGLPVRILKKWMKYAKIKRYKSNHVLPNRPQSPRLRPPYLPDLPAGSHFGHRVDTAQNHRGGVRGLRGGHAHPRAVD